MTAHNNSDDIIPASEIPSRLAKNWLVINEVCATYFKTKDFPFEFLLSAHRGNRDIINTSVRSSGPYPTDVNHEAIVIVDALHDGVRKVSDDLGRLFKPKESISEDIQILGSNISHNINAYKKHTSYLGTVTQALHGKDVRKPHRVPFDRLNAPPEDGKPEKPELISLESVKETIDQNFDKLSSADQKKVTETYAAIEKLSASTEELFVQLKQELFHQPTITLGKDLIVENPLSPIDMQNVEVPELDTTASVGYALHTLEYLSRSDQNTMKGMEITAVLAGYLFGDKENIVPSVLNLLQVTQLIHEPVIIGVFNKQKNIIASKTANAFETFEIMNDYMAENPKMGDLTENLGLTTPQAFAEAKAAYEKARTEQEKQAIILADCPAHEVPTPSNEETSAPVSGCPYPHGAGNTGARCPFPH